MTRRRPRREVILEHEIAAFRALERPNTVGIAGNDRVMLRFLAAWSYMPSGKWRMPERACPKEERERWMWLWDGLEVSLDAIARASGLDLEDVTQAFYTAISLRLIFPDGSLSEVARQALARAVA